MSKPLQPINKYEEQIVYDALYQYYLFCRDIAESSHVAKDVFAERAYVVLAIIKSIRDNLDWDIVH